MQHISTLDHTAHVYTQCDRCAYAGLVKHAVQKYCPHATLDRCVYAPWPQKEIKEQKTAEAKTEEQETMGTKAEKQTPQVRPTPSSPSLLR